MTEAKWLTSEDPSAMVREMIRPRSPGDPPDPLHGYSVRKLRLFACACCRAVWDHLTDGMPKGNLGGTQLALDELETLLEPALLARREDVLRRADDGAGACVRAACDRDVGRAAENAAFYARQFATAASQADLLREIVGNPFRPLTYPCCEGVRRVERVPGDATTLVGGSCQIHGVTHHLKGAGWLTPTVLSLAQAAYDERGSRCKKCRGTGKELSPVYADGPIGSTAAEVARYSPIMNSRCPASCRDGKIADGTLDPVRLAVLSDALEEAGCDQEMLLMHLRGQQMCLCEMQRLYGIELPARKPAPGGQMITCFACHDGWRPLRGPHVRGCWALDLILGLS